MFVLYIDPGAGSLLIQALIAAAVSVPFFFRRALRTGWQRIRGSAPPDNNETGSDGEEPR